MFHINRYLRAVVGGLALLGGVGVAVIAFRSDEAEGIGALLLNLAPELFGVAITVVLVDWLFERRQALDEMRRIAWEALLELDQVVYFWQGGSRVFYLEELLGLLGKVQEDDPIHYATRNLLLRLGSRAANTLKTNPHIAHAHPKLWAGLTKTAKLEAAAAGREP